MPTATVHYHIKFNSGNERRHCHDETKTKKKEKHLDCAMKLKDYDSIIYFVIW